MALCIASLFGMTLPSLSGVLLKWLGIGAGMTYALFLVHFPVKNAVMYAYDVFREHTDAAMNITIPSALLKLTALAVSAVISYFIYEYVEERWIRKMVKGRQRSVPGVLPTDGENH